MEHSVLGGTRTNGKAFCGGLTPNPPETCEYDAPMKKGGIYQVLLVVKDSEIERLY